MTPNTTIPLSLAVSQIKEIVGDHDVRFIISELLPCGNCVNIDAVTEAIIDGIHRDLVPNLGSRLNDFAYTERLIVAKRYIAPVRALQALALLSSLDSIDIKNHAFDYSAMLRLSFVIKKLLRSHNSCATRVMALSIASYLLLRSKSTEVRPWITGIAVSSILIEVTRTIMAMCMWSIRNVEKKHHRRGMSSSIRNAVGLTSDFLWQRTITLDSEHSSNRVGSGWRRLSKIVRFDDDTSNSY